MPRIPDIELERLKTDVSLVRLIESQGHTLTKRGKDWVMRCVFHEEETPSLSISESKNLYHCFGCGVTWLEMNCNPVLPPDTYPTILNSVFGQTT